mmetsp:Transcript_6007/g.14573  ORF Transcript_6007/g.14573 Transcript_6007/m.14573 type:complete len:116 (+) Transcript_6007:1057-1404(+)
MKAVRWQGFDASSFGKERTRPEWWRVRFFGRKPSEPWRGASNLRCDMVRPAARRGECGGWLAAAWGARSVPLARAAALFCTSLVEGNMLARSSSAAYGAVPVALRRYGGVRDGFR